MTNLFRWEMRQTLRSKAFWGIGFIFTAICVLFAFMGLDDGAAPLDLFIQNCNNFNSLMVFFIGIYAGIHVTGAFEDRRIQAAVMAGNSRFSILLAKMASFAISVTCFCFASVSVSSAVIFAKLGTGMTAATFMKEVLLRLLIYFFVETAYAGICFFLALLVKNLGAAIAINLTAMLVLTSIPEFIRSEKILDLFNQLTPSGQSVWLLVDGTPANMVRALAVALAGIAAILGVSFLRFRRQELK